VGKDRSGQEQRGSKKKKIERDNLRRKREEIPSKPKNYQRRQAMFKRKKGNCMGGGRKKARDAPSECTGKTCIREARVHEGTKIYDAAGE